MGPTSNPHLLELRGLVHFDGLATNRQSGEPLTEFVDARGIGRFKGQTLDYTAGCHCSVDSFKRGVVGPFEHRPKSQDDYFENVQNSVIPVMPEKTHAAPRRKMQTRPIRVGVRLTGRRENGPLNPRPL